ncbi:hypothetical protein [Streptomyces xiamenensis]|uniref:hypothetical protein n=1 Tax=Streptomyces xiamenensis TaxID=408015 RepID=UPI0037D594C1
MTERQEMTRRPGVPARRVGDLIEVPVYVLLGEEDGDEPTEAVLLLPAAAAEVLHTQLCRLLDGERPAADAPVCRFATPAAALAAKAVRRGIA